MRTLSFPILTRLFIIICAAPIVATCTPSPEASVDLEAMARAALAQIEGEIAIPGLEDEVEVLRDRWGVPHIYASNMDDLFFAQGFEGNHVVVIPSRNLVLVRLGLTMAYDGTWDIEEFVRRVLEAVPE